MRHVSLLCNLLALAAAARSVAGIPSGGSSSSSSSSSSSYESRDRVAPLRVLPDAQPITDAYMVVFKDHVDDSLFQTQLQRVHGAHQQDVRASPGILSQGLAGVRHVYQVGSLKGFSGTFARDTLDFIRRLEHVEYVERDSVVTTQEMPHAGEHVWANGYDAEAARMLGTVDTQSNAPWGLARISHRKKLSFGTLGQYGYAHAPGAGVTAYIIDTGINIHHVEFEGRASWGKTIPQGDVDEDANGHGTHCAGTIGSRAYGVAKNAELVAVKVLGSSGSGSMSDVTAGVVWAVNDATARAGKDGKKGKGYVANMSLGGGKSPTLDRAVNAAVDAGIHFAVAAGNDNRDACTSSPAAAEKPVTVAASTIVDERAYFSNKGTCVDIFAPGLSILSTWNTGNRSTNTISGTSMATPHIVGLLASLLTSVPDFSVFDVADDGQAETGSVVQRIWDDLVGAVDALLPDFLPSLGGLDRHALHGDDMTSGKKHGKKHKKNKKHHRRGHGNEETVLGVTSPRLLRKALLKLATSRALTDIDADTVNLLAYNNQSDASDRTWSPRVHSLW